MCVVTANKCLLCFLKTEVKLQKKKCWRGTRSLSGWKAKRWPFWHQLGFGNNNAWQQLILAFSLYFCSGLRFRSKEVQTSITLYKDSNARMPPNPHFYITQIHKQRVCTRVNKPAPSGIIAQLRAMEVKRDNQPVPIIRQQKDQVQFPTRHFRNQLTFCCGEILTNIMTWLSMKLKLVYTF